MVKRLFGFGDSQRQANKELARKVFINARKRKFKVLQFLRQKLPARQLAVENLKHRIADKKSALASVKQKALRLAGALENGKQKEKTASEKLKVQQDANTSLQDQYQEAQDEIAVLQKYIDEQEPKCDLMEDCLRDKDKIMMLVDCKSKQEFRDLTGVECFETLLQFTATQAMLDAFCEDLNTQGIYMSVAYEGEGPLSLSHNKPDSVRRRELAKIFGVDAHYDHETAALDQFVDGLTEDVVEDNQKPPSKKQKTG